MTSLSSGESATISLSPEFISDWLSHGDRARVNLKTGKPTHVRYCGKEYLEGKKGKILPFTKWQLFMYKHGYSGRRNPDIGPNYWDRYTQRDGYDDRRSTFYKAYDDNGDFICNVLVTPYSGGTWDIDWGI